MTMMMERDDDFTDEQALSTMGMDSYKPRLLLVDAWCS